MTDKPPEDKKPDDEAFQRTLRNLVNTPHKPHEPIGKRSHGKDSDQTPQPD